MAAKVHEPRVAPLNKKLRLVVAFAASMIEADVEPAAIKRFLVVLRPGELDVLSDAEVRRALGMLGLQDA